MKINSGGSVGVAGLRLPIGVELDDKAHTSLYMRLCKNTPRPILEEARGFVKGATNAKSKGRLFMWKVKELKDSDMMGGS